MKSPNASARESVQKNKFYMINSFFYNIQVDEFKRVACKINPTYDLDDKRAEESFKKYFVQKDEEQPLFYKKLTFIALDQMNYTFSYIPKMAIAVDENRMQGIDMSIHKEISRIPGDKVKLMKTVEAKDFKRFTNIAYANIKDKLI